MQPTILITIDVEDWFQVENFRPWIPFETWDQRELRVERNVHRLLDLFDSFEVSHSAKGIAHRVEDTAGKDDELENFSRRRIGFFHFHPGSGKDKINPDNPVNPVKKNKDRIQTTFFILGWIAERLPHLIREIHDRGHEVASHGYNHKLCHQQSQSDQKKDLSDSKKSLEDITGSQVFGFRAPNFSINDDTLKTIEECGYRYDSSYNSFGLHGRYGKISLNGHSKKGIVLQISDSFFELPISNVHFEYALRFRPSALSPRRRFVLPWGGGAYFRLIPFLFFRHGVQSILKKSGVYVFYMHPWEIDSDQPVVESASLISKFKHYSNISKNQNKIMKLITSFSDCRFISCKEYLEPVGRSGRF